MSIAEQYTIIKKLGDQNRRKFGETYLVENKTSGLKNILKMAKKRQGKEHLEERLRQESNFHFEFEGLPEVSDFNESKTELLLVRPFISGVQLDYYWKSLKRRDRIPFLIQVIEQLTKIFNHLSEHQIVHCDIKPSNIIIENRKNTIVVHLIDFGLAIDRKNIIRRSTLFPLGYAPPEILLNQLDLVDQRSDIFALGIMIWRLYSDKLPLAHPNPSIFTNLQLTHPLPRHESISEDLYLILNKMSNKYQFKVPPNKIDLNIVRQNLSEAMDQRYATLSEVMSEIRQLKKKRFFI